LRCWSFDLHVAFVQAIHAFKLNGLNLCILANRISPFDHVINQPPKSYMPHATLENDFLKAT
jgi:hypothetical protein